jgi:hypothetical protein
MLRYGVRLSVSVATFIVGLALSFVPSLFSTGAPERGSFEREVMEANQAYLKAHLEHDTATLDDLLADEFTVGGRDGGVTTKAQRLALLKNAVYSFIDIDSRDTRITATENYGEVSGYAVLTSKYAGREATSHSYHYTRRFERRDGRWQVTGVETSRGCGMSSRH